MARAEYDIDTIRERLGVVAVLRAGGLDDVADDARRIRCPICDATETSFAIFDSGRRYHCHRGSCGASGDALDLIRWIWGGNFPGALARAAALVGVVPGPGPSVRARPAGDFESLRERRTREQLVRAAQSTKTSTAFWSTLLFGQWGKNRWAYLHDYLRVRGLAGVLAPYDGLMSSDRHYRPADRRLSAVLLPSERGELALAILDDTEVDDFGPVAASGHAIVGVALRGVVRTVEHEHDFPVEGPIVAWGDRTPKVRCHPGSSTRGTFGAPRRVRSGGCCVLVEGMADFLAAHLVYRDEVTAILGAHSAGMMEHAASVACERLGPGGELVLATHADDAGRAAEMKVVAVATARAVNVKRHPLGSYKDLADQVAAR